MLDLPSTMKELPEWVGGSSEYCLHQLQQGFQHYLSQHPHSQTQELDWMSGQ